MHVCILIITFAQDDCAHCLWAGHKAKTCMPGRLAHSCAAGPQRQNGSVSNKRYLHAFNTSTARRELYRSTCAGTDITSHECH